MIDTNIVLSELLQGKTNCLTLNFNIHANTIITNFLNDIDFNIKDVENIIHISNILYNNSDLDILILEDGIYDIALEKYKQINPNFQVGAEPVYFESINTQASDKPLQKIFNYESKPDTEDFLFEDELNIKLPVNKNDLLTKIIHFENEELVCKRVGDATHNYPKLVGTLDKCKFVLNKQAQDKGVYNDSNVKILERDFFGKHIMDGILDPNRSFTMVLELKYDGISVEADVTDCVKSARSRGDANEGLATDLSPILRGYSFKHSKGIIDDREVIGMKFEAIMTHSNLSMFNHLKQKDYKNCRTAISGLFSGLDAIQYRDLITLVPLATSIEDIDRVTEIEFINKYYRSEEPLRYAVITGNYRECLFQIKRFVEEAEYMRNYLPFMYDGIVVSYVDKDLIDILGRKNSINKYSMAIKFNALKRQTVFTGYTFTIGQDGSITPMIHYNPVEFYGTIHDKSTGHSYERFKTLGLRIGDIIDVEYVNDVMPYVTKPDNSHNKENENNQIFEFIKICPSCGTTLEISESGKSVFCNNIQCPERNIKRVVSMIDKLNIKDFSEAYVAAISKFKLKELLNLKLEDVEFLGDLTSKKFIDRMDEIKTKSIYDYKIVGSLGFDGIAIEKWKLILSNYTLIEILSMDYETLKQSIVSIKGIGPITADIIVNEFEFFREDIEMISTMQNVIISKGVKSGKTIRFTGFRDKQLLDYLVDLGHNAGEGAVTKATDILLIPYDGFSSSKTSKVKDPTQIVSVQEFKDNMGMYLNT